jgi:hypothetical protein
MLFDCAKLRHWHVERQFYDVFEGKRDNMQWLDLILEDRSPSAYAKMNGVILIT